MVKCSLSIAVQTHEPYVQLADAGLLTGRRAVAGGGAAVGARREAKNEGLCAADGLGALVAGAAARPVGRGALRRSLVRSRQPQLTSAG